MTISGELVRMTRSEDKFSQYHFSKKKSPREIPSSADWRPRVFPGGSGERGVMNRDFPPAASPITLLLRALDLKGNAQIHII